MALFGIPARTFRRVTAARHLRAVAAATGGRARNAAVNKDRAANRMRAISAETVGAGTPRSAVDLRLSV